MKSTGCISITPIPIGPVPPPHDTPIGSITKQPDCIDQTGTIEISDPPVNTGHEYSLDGSSFGSSNIFANLAPGKHEVIVRSKISPCLSGALELTIDPVPPYPLPPALNGPPPFAECEKSPLQTLNANDAILAEAGTTIIWYDKPSGGTQISSPTLMMVGNVTYYAEAVRGNCVSLSRTEVKLEIYPTPLIPISKGDLTECALSPLQTLDANTVIIPVAGNKINWFDAPTGGNIVASPILNSVNAITYYAEADNGNCVSPGRTPVTLTINPTPAAPVWVSNGEITDCEINPIQTLDANKAIVPVAGTIVTWYDQLLGGSFVPSPVLNKVGTITYYAETTVGACIGSPRTPVKLTINPIPAMPVWLHDLSECELSQIQTLDARTCVAAPPVGTTIKWYASAVGGTPIGSPTLNSTTSITYYAEASIGDCVSTGRTAVRLTIIPAPIVLVNQNPVQVCATRPVQTLDARTYVSVAPPINLIWYDKAVGGNKVVNPVLNKIGTITYYAETFNGTCPSPARTAITLTIFAIPDAPEAIVTIPPSCKDENGTFEITKPKGIDIEYSIDSVTFQTSPVFANLKSKSYTIWARNMSTLCESNSGIVVLPPVPPAPIMKVAVADSCKCYGYDGAINFEFENVDDGTYVIVYLGGEFRNVQVKNNIAKVLAKAGTYSILAIEANGCTSSENRNVVISQPDPILVTATITEIDLKSQQKGAIDITVTGGSGKYSYKWDNGATTQDIKNLSDGTYTVTVTDNNACKTPQSFIIPIPNLPPVAVDDNFTAGCGTVAGNLLDNDSDPDHDLFYIELTLIKSPAHGTLILNPDLSGAFTYTAIPGYTGPDEFQYITYDIKKNLSNVATVKILMIADFDCDGIPDELDPDADGDGILNTDDGYTDTDGDGHPNWLDIDADNDGIVDNFEAQSTPGYIPPSGLDDDHDGLDNAYDTDKGHANIVPVDTDKDGIPDFLDTDSDNDLVPDYIEGHDGIDADGKPESVLIGKDADADGLDDGFDTVNRFQSPIENMTGSNAEMQDFDGDGEKDWRDDNDDDDQYPTRFEDLNADGDYSNDDTDFDGHPEYLDYGRDCDLFIPDAFSPNNDNIHEYFQIYCIDHFPDAKIYIFDQLGNKIFEKEHYGNLNFWNTPERAWWDGKTTNRSTTQVNGKVTPGTYFYVLKLGNGEVKKSFVFVSY